MPHLLPGVGSVRIVPGVAGCSRQEWPIMSRQRGFLVALFAVVLTLVVAAPVDAGRRWCEADPIVLIAGTEVGVVTAVLEEDLPVVTGPVAVTIYVPEGVPAFLVSTDAGYNGYGEVVTFLPVPWLTVTERGVQARVEVVLPAGRPNVPVQVAVSPGGARTASVSGRANTAIPVQFMV
jgi:hypothetical protein